MTGLPTVSNIFEDFKKSLNKTTDDSREIQLINSILNDTKISPMTNPQCLLDKLSDDMVIPEDYRNQLNCKLLKLANILNNPDSSNNT
jgi:hypothetical protein